MSGVTKINFKKIQSGVEKTTKSKWFTLLLILIPIFLAFFFRVYPVTLPIADDWAESNIREGVLQQIRAQIRQDFPVLPDQQVNSRANELYADYAKQNAAELETQKQQIAENLRSRLQTTFIKPNGATYEQTYFLAIDPYLYLRRAENIAETGMICDEIRDGVCWNTHIHAPYGREQKADYHSVVEAVFITVAGWFGYSSMTGAFYIPAIIAALSIIPVFFIVRKYYGDLAGLVAGIVVATHVVFLGRTPAGFVDTDVWNVFFPLFITWLFLLAVDMKDKKKYFFMAGSGILLAIYSKFWGGFFFTMTILILVLIGTALFSVARYVLSRMDKIKADNKLELAEVKNSFILLGVFVVSAAILITILSGPKAFIGALQAPLQTSLTIQDPINANLWPNVLTTVAELNTVSVRTIVSQIGGRFLLIAAIFGIFTSFFNPKKMDWKQWSVAGAIVLYYVLLTTPKALVMNVITYLALFSLPLIAALVYQLIQKEHMNTHYALMMMGWFLASIYATTQGTRFLLLLVPILGIALGSAAGWIARALPNVLKDELKLPLFWGKSATVVLVLFLLLAPASANMLGKANNVAKGEVPSMNDAWWDALTAINVDSEEDAIITSWWDFGHWFKYIADRSVNFDGGSQNNPNAHWVGKLLQTDDEVESIGILRMIDCGGNNAFRTINDEKQNTLKSYHITSSLIGISTDEADEILEDEGFSKSQREEILTYTHCTPPDAYLVVSEDMIGKAGVWGHFGAWDFDRAFVYSASKSYDRQEAIDVIAEQLEVEATEASNLYTAVTSLEDNRDVNSWISPWPAFLGVRGCTEDNETLTCNIGMSVGQQQGVHIVADRIHINKSNISSAGISLMAQGQLVGNLEPDYLYLDGEVYNLGGEFNLGIHIENNRVVVGDKIMVGGLFANTFYRENEGKYLDRLIKTTQVTGGKIIVYKVDWEAYFDDVENE